MIRYVLDQKSIKWLYSEPNSKSDKFQIKYSPDNVFVDILAFSEQDNPCGPGDWANLKLYYSDGDIILGWTGQMNVLCPLRLIDTNCDDGSLLPSVLFDGRFNS